MASANAFFSIHIRETTNVSPEIKRRREAKRMVADLFQRTPLRADVLERSRSPPGMSSSLRQQGIAVARTYPENPLALNYFAWELVKLAGGEMSGFRKALRYSEEACQLEPKDGRSLNTLGVAYHRVGNYEKALETLQRSDQINEAQFQGSNPLSSPSSQ